MECRSLKLTTNNLYLFEYDWPGNVRELRNLVERIAILSPNEKNEISI
jgi:two-component system nitrogen regulation response regulator NtrX